MISKISRFTLSELSEKPDLVGEDLHRHLFTQGGMTIAVHNLKSSWEQGNWGLGYSAGGTALWQTAASGHDFAGIFCISSTRLRNEDKIDIPHHVFFGAEDQNRPRASWLSAVPRKFTLMENAGHTYYLETEKDAVSLTAQAIADEINALTLCSE
jgi:pimeloyl-ACP methyl ester carboxylesterase